MKVSTAVIVGSDPYCARILEFALNRRRLNVVRAQHTLGLRGLLVAFKPDLVLIETDMPELDCEGVVAFLRRQPETQGARVVLYSRQEHPLSETHEVHHGADGHIAVAREVAVTEHHLDPWLPSPP
ncbi:response regulator [Chondromyces apiculatus]|uniref:Response regulatory domain-containing protein n=1 Tax=Chondromyces apiculatus DSM 436 TaxID=1192034 RepID=A0A017SZX9_9BACT|nr:response regulator [Chondromyces apiculatus]EYF02518.1 Hypothetical protein CAP_6725 [Chondromyces apiculatus DSM 436]